MLVGVPYFIDDFQPPGRSLLERHCTEAINKYLKFVQPPAEDLSWGESIGTGGWIETA